MKVLSTFRPAFFPNLLYFWQMAQSQVVVFTDHLQFSKGTIINRSAPLNTTQDILTIPVQHDQKQLPIALKRIVPREQWKEKHLKTLHHLFHNFPFAEDYLPQIEEIYRAEKQFLGDFLFALTEKIIHWLHLPVQPVRSAQLLKAGDGTQTVLKWCKRFHCEAYIAHPETFEKSWIDAKRLKEQQIRPLLFSGLPASHLLEHYATRSIIHFIFQFGPEAGYILKQYSSNERRNWLPNAH